jgi:hypothetical protein
MAVERGWGFRTFLGKTHVINFLATGIVMNASLRISLTSLLVKMDFSSSYGNIDSVLFFHYSGCISSSSSEFIYVRSYFFNTSEPKIGPTPSYFPLFFIISAGKM